MKALANFLRNLLFSRPAQSSGSLWIYLCCDRCGEALKTRINLQNDLSVEYANNPRKDRFYTHKTVIGSKRCFQRIDVQLQFDAQKQVLSEELHGGTRISEQEYLALRGDQIQS